MSCFACSKISTTEQGVIKYYKDLYNKKGLIYYVYRLSEKDSLKIVEKSSFNRIFEEQIQPNFNKGAEYFSIKEFTG